MTRYCIVAPCCRQDYGGVSRGALTAGCGPGRKEKGSAYRGAALPDGRATVGLGSPRGELRPG